MLKYRYGTYIIKEILFVKKYLYKNIVPANLIPAERRIVEREFKDITNGETTHTTILDTAAWAVSAGKSPISWRVPRRFQVFRA